MKKNLHIKKIFYIFTIYCDCERCQINREYNSSTNGDSIFDTINDTIIDVSENDCWRPRFSAVINHRIVVVNTFKFCVKLNT